MTKVEFNCLKLVLSIDSWVAVLDFFGIAGDEPDQSSTATDSNKTSESIICRLYFALASKFIKVGYGKKYFAQNLKIWCIPSG